MESTKLKSLSIAGDCEIEGVSENDASNACICVCVNMTIKQTQIFLIVVDNPQCAVLLYYDDDD